MRGGKRRLLGTGPQPWDPGGAVQERRTQTWSSHRGGRITAGPGGEEESGPVSPELCPSRGSGGSRAGLRAPLTFSFSMREGMKLLLSAGRLVTGWIITSCVKKSTAGWGGRRPTVLLRLLPSLGQPRAWGRSSAMALPRRG